jgi:hypothetical protein
MLRLAAPFVGLAALLASPAHAQSAAPPQPPSDPSRGAMDVESGAEWFGIGNATYGFAMDCSELSFRLKGLDAEADAAERLSKGFEKVGWGLTAIAAGSQAYQGRSADALQTVGEAGLDTFVCKVWPGPVCVGWTAGRMAGSVIKTWPMPGDSQNRSIEEAVLDGQVHFAQLLMPSLNQPMNVENMRAAFDAFQRQRSALLNARDRARDRANQCSNDHHGDEPDYAGRDGGSGQGTSSSRAMELFRGNGGDPNQSWNNAANYSSGQSSAPTYSPAPVQQSQPSSSSGFDFGQAIGAALTGYAIGTAANQSSSSSKPSSTPAYTPPVYSDDSCHNSQLPEGMVCTAN